MVRIVNHKADLDSCIRYEVVTVDVLNRIGLVSVSKNERQEEFHVSWYGQIYDAVAVIGDLLDADK